MEGELDAEGETGEDELFVGFSGVVAAAAAVHVWRKWLCWVIS